MVEVVIPGEILVEIMRTEKDVAFTEVGLFRGPYPSGAPAICADAIARLGGSVGMIGVVGDDDFGRVVVDRLRNDGVNVSHIRVAEGYTTGTAFVMYRRDGSRKFIFHLRHAAAGQLSPEDINEDYVASARWLHLMGSAISVSESSMEACYRALEIAAENGLRISLDPNLRPELLGVERIREILRPVLDEAYLVLPSGEEVKMITDASSPEDACRELINRGVKIVALKRGEKGSRVYTEEEVIDVPSIRVEEVDPTGAGDTYDGAFIYGLLKGWDIRDVALFANVAGALSVTKFGPMEGCPFRGDVEKRLKEVRSQAPL
ncbi:MAG TPA: sugar kinase [Candidatus Bathyarchaeota archaeon]|nr:sugar kinase [Candidatus Bathyarchaeota archaeon]